MTSPGGASERPSHAPHEAERDGGFIAIVFGLLLIPIVIFTALAVDVSSWYSRATELQRTADAAALAGVVWMPDFGEAQENAEPVLEQNGVVGGAGNMTVSMAVGETGITSFKVCVTDTKVTQFFGAVFASPTKMTRCGTAQYNAPLQLGSPLNYFGGNHDALSKYIAGTTPPNPVSIPDRTVFGNGPYRNFCNVRASYPSGSIVGYWYRDGYDSQSRWYYALGVSTYGNNPNDCGTAPLPEPDIESFGGANVYCTLLGGRWERWGGVSSTIRRYWVSYGSSSYPDCGFNGSAHHPIPEEKSPNFWAAVEGYRNSHGNGDAFSTNGSEHRDTGYWYSIDVPDGGVSDGNISIQAWDLSYNCDSGCRTAMGDDANNGTTPTRMVVYRAGTLKYDMSAITPLTGCDTGWISGSGSATYNLRWNEVCNIGTASPGNRYYVNVLSNDGTYGSSGGGYNGYALRAVSGTYPTACMDYMPSADIACYGAAGSIQPRLSAYGDMEMYNGINAGQPTQFYLADVTPTYGGKTLEIKLFDPGDGAPESWVTIRGPSSTDPEGEMIPASACAVQSRKYGQDTWSNVPLSDGPGTPEYSDKCTVQTSGGSTAGACSSSNNHFNDCWLRFRITLPSDYGTAGTAAWTKCDPNTEDPTVTAGSCWWQISYYVGGSGSLSDYTTWSAGIINDPVRLVR